MTSEKFSYKLICKDRNTSARRGQITTPHGTVETPVFMPVGTYGSVKAVSSDDLERMGFEIILGNTYHLYLRPGDNLISDCGGLHRFNSDINRFGGISDFQPEIACENHRGGRAFQIPY